MALDYDRLRKDLIDYIGTLISIYPAVTMDLMYLENATNEELIEIALRYDVDLDGYQFKSFTI